MTGKIDDRQIERAEKALLRAGFTVETSKSKNGETVTFKVGALD